MSESIAVRCDGPNCTKVKTAANHWVRISELGDPTADVTIVLGPVRPLAPSLLGGARMLDFCGEGCLYRYLSKQLKLPSSTAEEQS